MGVPTRGRSPGEPRLANLIGALATGVTDAMHGAMGEAAQMDVASASALVALLDFAPGGTISTLSRIVGLTHSGTVRLVDRLFDRGYVTRGRGQDARSRPLTLTPRGAALARRILHAREQAITGPLERLSAAQRARLEEICGDLVSALTQQRLDQRAADVAPAGGALCRTCDFVACDRRAGRCPSAATAAARS